MNKLVISLITASLIMLAGCQQKTVETPSQAPVSGIPSPAEMKTDVVVSGRVSTLNHIDIVNVGQNIPYTYSDGKVHNTPGYEWWVSKHFALKTDYPEERAKLFLELLEMSYPHYVEAYGGVEPPNIEKQRIAVVYGSTWSKTMFAFYDDGFRRGISAGGETMYYNRVGYNFPSHRWHHRRYIVIHETAHAFQMAQRGYSGGALHWLVEGLADSIAHHVYDPKTHQLKLMNFDRPPMNFVEDGLKQYEQYGQPTIRNILVEKRYMRGLWLLFTHFMLDDPARSHKYKRYQREFGMLADQSLSRAEIEKVTQEIYDRLFPDWQKFEKDFVAWISATKHTFHISRSPWEQDGNALWVRIDPPPDFRYGRKPKRNRADGTPRVDINLPPGEEPTYSPYRLDYPLPELSRLVGPVKRGIEEPSIGMHIDYVKAHLNRGLVGYALGVNVTQANKKALAIEAQAERLEAHKPDTDFMYRVSIIQGDSLLLDGSSYGAERLHFALPETMVDALNAQEHPQLGMKITIAKQALKVVLKTGPQGQIKFERSAPLSQEIREKLLSLPVAVQGFDANHRMTPYLDDGRELNPHPVDLKKPAAPNFWRNPGDKHAERLFGVIWALGEEQTPASVKQLYADMISAADKDRRAQREALDKFRKQRTQIVSDIAASGLPNAAEGVLELSAATLRLEWDRKNADGTRLVSAVVRNPSETVLSGNISMTLNRADGSQQLIETVQVNIQPGKDGRVAYTVPKPVWGIDHMINATAELTWEGQSFSLQASSKDRPYEGVDLEVTKPVQIEDGYITLEAVLVGPFGGKNLGNIRFEVLPANIVEQGLVEEKIDMGIYEVKTFQKRFKLKPGADASQFAVDIQADFVADGEDLHLQARSTYQ